MTTSQFLKLIVCPQCKKKLRISYSISFCTNCSLKFKKTQGIWDFLLATNKKSEISRKQYNAIHQKSFNGPGDGSYEILACIARGNKTVDIACGQGFIEKLSSETIGVDFSLNALKKATANGAKYLVHADAHTLPFADDAFDVAISAGNLEHFTNPQQAINEMARVSKIQVLTVHRQLPIPFAEMLRNIATSLWKIRHQPIERPISQSTLERMLYNAGLHVVFKGVWTLPVNYGRVVKILPEFTNIPSCHFVIAIKK